MSVLVPSGVPEQVWVVIDTKKGERHLLFKEPLEGWAEWTKNSKAKVFEYGFRAVIYEPPPPPKKPAAK